MSRGKPDVEEPGVGHRVSVAAIIRMGGKVFIARRKPGGDLGGLWEFPGGKCEIGEKPEDTVVRELAEEFGARARVVTALGRTSFVHGSRDYTLIGFETVLDEPACFLLEHDETAMVEPDELDGLDFAPSDRGLFRFVKGSCR
ncbi:MAG: NUDIX domain-containing protein [Spirochaetes bacterium]|nr:NUDIX domain-containing protein [Spirochaetota bacterium]